MIRWRPGTVRSILRDHPAVREVLTDTDDGPVPALAYVELVGAPEPGERVLLNTTALVQGLGTGGHALVVAVPDRLPPDPHAPGHVVKARYTPLQTTVLGVDEQDSPHHRSIAAAQSLDGMPVVVADLHSALPAIVAGVLADRPDARIAYVLTDGGALPMAYSRTVTALRVQLCGTVSSGQSFGGDLEAVTVHTGLLAARHVLSADVAVVAQGPGNLGTGTTWGFSGVAAGDAVNAAAILGGRPIGCLRVSAADPRPRHRGVSHHSITAYGRVALVPADLPVPASLRARLAGDLARFPPRHRIVEVAGDGLDARLRASPAVLSSMGRGLDEDPDYFLTAAVAGRHAAALLDQPVAPG